MTSHRMQITYKHGTSFTADNYTHWILSTQNFRSIPIEPGDTRIVLWEVTPYEGDEIDTDTLLGELRKEAPFFMRQLAELDLTGVAGRHTLPALMTKEKARAMKTVAAEKEFPGLDGDASRRPRPSSKWTSRGGRDRRPNSATRSAIGTEKRPRTHSRAGRTRWDAI